MDAQHVQLEAGKDTVAARAVRFLGHGEECCARSRPTRSFEARLTLAFHCVMRIGVRFGVHTSTQAEHSTDVRRTL